MRHASDLLKGATTFAAISLAVALLVPETRHWFLLFTTASATLLTPDALAAIRGERDILSPRAVVALFGIHFFYAVPILHFALDHWPRYVDPAADWADSFGLLAAIHLAGLLAYVGAVSATPVVLPRVRTIERRALGGAVAVGLVIGVVSWALVTLEFGGPVRYLSALVDESADLTGLGSILLFAESWPSIAMAFLLVTRRRQLAARPALHILLFVAFVAVQFLVGGLRGSRALTVWPLVIMLTISHLTVREIRRRTLVLLGVLLLAFSALYAFYKSVGSDISRLFSGDVGVSALAAETGRDLAALLTEDFGRTAVQALILDRQSENPTYAFGETYVGDALAFIPDALQLEEFRDKSEFGTIALYGAPSDELGGYVTSRIFGLAGEALLNFGPLGVVAAFLAYGLLVGLLDRSYEQYRRIPGALASRVIAGTFPALVLITLISDLDNVILFLLKYALPVIGVFLVGSTPVRRPTARADQGPVTLPRSPLTPHASRMG